MSDTQQLRARRRYRALLREAQNLELQGRTDEKLTVELQRLEQEFPMLRERVGPAEDGSKTENDAPQTEDVSKQLPVAAAPSSGAPSGTESLAKQCAEQSAAPPPYRSALPTRHTNGDYGTKKRNNDPSTVGCTGFFCCALSLWGEAHLPTSFGVFSYAKIMFFSILAAILHRYVVDPSSTVGKAISPVLIGLLVHAQGLIALQRKRPGRISMTMLIVYFIFDVLPSIVLVFVVYVLTTIGLEMLK
ncbi:hypothetical protein DQ04_02361110 [Trypanosoma grayi]|uniref:hypothetical protein n=1 Tax=Trypanosoma grayi TaxID=71804 RepID=UPI0004F492F3|nr:hypothetical protein DQ04_02361110 [Trypanosoma grayi]KEG11699.1 hypothetical protein DQ04_02361110 [Trypanosoma grayi]